MPTGGAPVCHLSPQVPVPAQLATGLPAIPFPGTAQTVSDLIPMLMAMKQFMEMLAGQYALLRQFRQPPSTVKPVTQDQKVSQGAKQDTKTTQWSEQSRQKSTVKVYNPDDKSQFIEIEQIDGITMVDQHTGQTWRWKR